MKRFILIAFAVTLMVSCNSGPKAGNESFDWLLGKWERTNENEGRQTIEMWSKVTDSEYKGYGATLQDGDTLWYENGLKALISGDDMEVVFDFKRISP